MKDTIERLVKERELLRNRIDKIDTAIKAFQDVCDHKHEHGADAFVEDGRDSHRTYYKCSICGYESS